MTAAEQLSQALLTLADRGQRTPCSGRDEWISEDGEDRLYAAASCRMCPLLQVCGAAADEGSEVWGVWAGHDRFARSSRSSRKAIA